MRLSRVSQIGILLALSSAGVALMLRSSESPVVSEEQKIPGRNGVRPNASSQTVAMLTPEESLRLADLYLHRKLSQTEWQLFWMQNAAKDPLGTMRALVELPFGNGKQGMEAVDGFLDGCTASPGDFLALCAQLPDCQVRSALLARRLRREAETNFPSGLAMAKDMALRGFPMNGRGGLLAIVAQGQPVDEFANTLKSIANEPAFAQEISVEFARDFVGNTLEPEKAAESLRAIHQTGLNWDVELAAVEAMLLRRSSADDGLAAVIGLYGDDPRIGKALLSRLSRWSLHDAPAASEWVAGFQSPALKDYATAGLAIGLANTNPEAAEAWILSIKDPALVKRARTSRITNGE